MLLKTKHGPFSQAGRRKEAAVPSNRLRHRRGEGYAVLGERVTKEGLWCAVTQAEGPHDRVKTVAKLHHLGVLGVAG